MSVVDRRLDELRARRAAREADRAAFEERRRHGVQARHAAKLAYLSARAEAAQLETAQAKADRAAGTPASAGGAQSPGTRYPRRKEVPEEPENSISPKQSLRPEAA